MQNYKTIIQPRAAQGANHQAKHEGQGRVRQASKAGPALAKSQLAVTTQSKQKTELSDVLVGDGEGNRSRPMADAENIDKENINTNNSELVTISEQEFQHSCTRGEARLLRPSQPSRVHHEEAKDDDYMSSEFNNQMDVDRKIFAQVRDEKLAKDSQDIRGKEDEEMNDEEVVSLRDHGESDSVSLRCQEEVDAIAEDQLVGQKEVVIVDKEDSQIEKKQGDSILQSVSAIDEGEREDAGKASAPPVNLPHQSRQEPNAEASKADGQAEQIESVLKEEGQSADHVMAASPTTLKLIQPVNTAPVVADNSMQYIGLINKHQENNNFQKIERAQHTHQNQGKKSVALLRTPRQEQQLKIFRNPIPTHQHVYHLHTQNMHASFGVNSEHTNAPRPKIESPDLPQVQHRRITMEPIKHDITTNTFGGRRQSPQQQQQDTSTNQIYRGTPQRTPQSRLRFNQSASQRISLAQLSSPVQQSLFRKRYSLMQSKPTMNNLKDQEDNQSNDPYVRLLSANSGNSFHNTSNKNHFDQFLGTKGRSKAAYEKSSFDSPERIGSSIKKKPSIKYYLNQFSNGKIANSNQKSKLFMSQDMKTPIKEQHKTNITPQKINDYQTLQNNQDMAEHADDDKRFSSNTTKKFVTRMHGGSIIHSNFKVNHHSVQKNKIRRSDSKSKSKQTNSSQKDIQKMGICRQLQFDAEAPIQSPCFNRDPTNKKFGALNRGGFSTSTANCINMMASTDRWTGLPVQGVQHQHFLDEKAFQVTAPFQQSFIQGAQHQRQMCEPAQLGKMMSNRPNLNASLSPHNNISSIFGLRQAQQMQQYTTRFLNPFGNSMAPRHQSSRKKNKKNKKKQSQTGAGDHYEGMEVDDSMLPFPYILQPIINIGGQMPSQLKKIYQVSASHVSPEKRNKHAGSSKQNEQTSSNFANIPNEGEKPQHCRPDDEDAQMNELGGETVGAKQRKRQRCNSSSETIKIYGPNESTQKQRVTNNSVITTSDRRNQESQGAGTEESSSSDYSDDDDEDESSSSSPKYARSYKHFLLQQQHEASAQFFGDNRMRLRLDDGILTAMPPQQQPHPLVYQQHLLSEHEQQMAVMDQLHPTIFDCQNVASPSKIKKSTGQCQHAEKCHNLGRHHHKVKMICSCGVWQDDHHCSTSNRNDSPISESTGRKHRQKSSLRKQRKREMKEKLSHNNKYAANHFYNSRSPNALASYNPAAGMMMPHYLGNESQYQRFQEINFMLQPRFHLGNINIVAGMNPHNAGLNQLNHHQMANLAGYSPQLLAHNAPGLALQQLNANAAVNPMGPQMLFANSFQGPISNNAKFGSSDEQHWTKKNQGREQVAGQTSGKRPKESRQRKSKQSMIGKKRQSAARNLEHEFTEHKASKHIKASEGASDPGIIQIKCANAKSSESKDKVVAIDGLQRQLTFSNTKNEGDNELMNEEGMLDDVEENMSSSLDQDHQFEPSIMVSKRIKSRGRNNNDSEMQESSVFKSPDQQEQQRTITRALNEAIGLPSQQKRTKSKSKKKANEGEQMTEQLMLQNFQSFNPNFTEAEGVQSQVQNQQINQSDQYFPPSRHKKRHTNKEDLLQITPDQKNKIEQGSRSQIAACQGFYAQTGQKKVSLGADALNIKTQSQARTNGAHGNADTGNSLMYGMFGFNNQNASADKIQVQKFNQNGLMESLNPVMTSQRNDHEQIRILNPQRKMTTQQQPSDDHITVSLSLMNSKKQLLTDQQPAFLNQSSFQNSAVKEYPISAGVNLDKTTFNNSVLANHTVQGANRHQRQSSSKKPTSIAGSNANLHSTNQGKRLTQQEKELQNHQNEENIRIKTEKIIGQTITQEELFAKPMVTQCKGCKCKNTKCLKLYCECLRNNATCGPACQCTRQGGECHNNDEHLADRKKAVEEILKRNIDAFESKVDSDKNMHFKGCKCKASECQKKYCECFERGVPCTPLCKCSNCKNTHQSVIERRQCQHEGGCRPEQHVAANPAVQTAAGVGPSDPVAAPRPFVLNESLPMNDLQKNEIQPEIITIQADKWEQGGENKVNEGQAKLIVEKDADRKQQEYQAKEIFKAAKIFNKQEAQQRPTDGAGPWVDGNTVQILSNPEAAKDLARPVAEAQITNPEEMMPITKAEVKDCVDDEARPKHGIVEDENPSDQLKNLVAQKEHRSADRAPAEKSLDENIENVNTLNVPVVSGKPQLDGFAPRVLEKTMKAEVTKKPMAASNEIQPQDRSPRDLQHAESPNKDSSEAAATHDQAKKQASQSSLANSKPVSKSKRLSEKASKETTKQSKPSENKASPPTHVTTFSNAREAQSPSQPDDQPRAPALAAKKSQSSLSSLVPAQQSSQQASRRPKKPQSLPQEKMQTRHQKKMLEKKQAPAPN